MTEKEITFARLTIYKHSDWTKERRAEVAKWLRAQALFLQSKGCRVARRYVATIGR